MPNHIPQPGSPGDLRPEAWRPSEARKVEMENLLWDRVMMRVYCDCSVAKRLGAFGTAAAYVYDGSVVVSSRKLYSQHTLQSVYGELQAVLHGIRELPGILKDTRTMPAEVEVFTDLADIDHLLSEPGTSHFADVVRQIASSQSAFTSRHPQISLTIGSLTTEEKRHNPYYAAAHNGARKAVLIEQR